MEAALSLVSLYHSSFFIYLVPIHRTTHILIGSRASKTSQSKATRVPTTTMSFCNKDEDTDTLPSYAEATNTSQTPASILRIEAASIHKRTSSLAKIRSSISSLHAKHSSEVGEGDGGDAACFGDDSEIFIRRRKRDQVSAAVLRVLASMFFASLWFGGLGHANFLDRQNT